MKIFFSPPDITDSDIEEVVGTLKSGWITTGSKTKQFEKEIALYCNTNEAVALNSATACLELMLRILGIGPGDEVITSAYTYSASASVIAHVGAKIVLADTAKDSFHLDYESLTECINERTKAIIPVDIAGVMCDYDRIFEIAESKKHLFKPSNKLQESIGRVAVVADAAHSLGARYKSKMSGEVADFTAFSFHAVKNLTTAEGGAITWKSIKCLDCEDVYHEFMLLSLHGQSKDALAKTNPDLWEYDIVAPYFKCNMTDIAASLGISQLRRYETILKKRKTIIEKYDELLQDLPLTPLRHFTAEQISSGHLYLTRIDNADEAYRNKVIHRMAEMGVSTNVHYKPLPMHTAYKNLGFDIKDYPNAYNMFKSEISLPLHTLLTIEDAEYVCKCFKTALSNA